MLIYNTEYYSISAAFCLNRAYHNCEFLRINKEKPFLKGLFFLLIKQGELFPLSSRRCQRARLKQHG